MKKLVKISLKGLWILILFVITLFVISELSPIYSFDDSSVFQGSEIYNPYASFDRENGWERTNIHTHTHATDWINECEYYPDSILDFYQQYGYDMVCFSNHMELTDYPDESEFEIPVYEHGFNFAKLHNLCFNPKRVIYYDSFLPFMTSQMQFKMDVLRRSSDFIFLNHPDRTSFISDDQMRLLTGYRLLEADSGFDDDDTYGQKWDMALSSGHYVLSAISDDLHKPKRSDRIARRCSFINIASASYEGFTEALLSGNFYSMHLPDYGDGDIETKIECNLSLPCVEDIGAESDTLFMKLSSKAAIIEAIGQNGEIVDTVMNSSSISYVMRPSDTYLRFVARYDDGAVIFSNPFARWTGESAYGTPYVEIEHPVNIIMTILYNLSILLLLFVTFLFTYRICKK